MPGEVESFNRWYCATLTDTCRVPARRARREGYWSSAFAVGDSEWLSALAGEREDLARYILEPESDSCPEDNCHVLNVPQTVFLRIWGALAKR